MNALPLLSLSLSAIFGLHACTDGAPKGPVKNTDTRTESQPTDAPTHDISAKDEGSGGTKVQLGPDELPPESDAYYGVYLNGHKVGWMRSAFQLQDEEVTSLMELQASVGGMGTVSKIELKEHRRYNRNNGKLTGLSFSQTAATGAVRVEGHARDGQLHLEITAGNNTRSQTVPVVETLDDALATVRLAAAGQVGKKIASKRFDPSVLKNLEAQHELLEQEERMFGGVTTKTAKIQTRYEDLGITEQAWLDATGTVLESQVGGFFVARLEPPDQAKKLDYSQDLLVSAVVKAPRSMTGVQNNERLELTFTGFGDNPPPESERQTVKVDGERVHLVLERDPPPSGPLTAPQPSDPYVEATPFIQSDDETLQEKAREVIGNAKTLSEAVEKLTHFVFHHVRDEYVPAYSNALESLNTRRGDCTEHSILFVGLARALGIPARVAVGIAYWPAGGGFGWHAWAEVRDGDRWIAVDPTGDQPVADVSHVKLADGGPAEQARIVMLLGRLRLTEVKL